jgi:hypothetical protein
MKSKRVVQAKKTGDGLIFVSVECDDHLWESESFETERAAYVDMLLTLLDYQNTSAVALELVAAKVLYGLKKKKTKKR